MIDKYIERIFKGIDENIKIDNEQKEVILDESDNLIVIAGAGSGKTTTIAAKVKYLVEIKRINPKEILIISLTNKAVNELKFRINDEFNIACDILTFHKFAYRILKKEDKRYRIISNNRKMIADIIKIRKETSRILKIIMKDKKIKKIDKTKYDRLEILIDMICENIKLIKVLNINIFNISIKDKRISFYLEYLKKIYYEYNNKLEEDYVLDFEDLILKCLTLKNIDCIYKYIIVDEYQDVSLSRFELLKKVSSMIKAKTIVVGDDFQSIYSFAGSDINLFLNYQKTMNARILKITNTYRNSQELIDVAGKFVMKDNNLIKKELHSIKKTNKPVRICGYKNNFDMEFENIILEIIKEYGINKNVLILGRCNKDIERIKSKKFIIKEDKIIYKNYPDLVIDYMSVHKSKGLGYDNVILINFNNEYKGFPIQIENNYMKEKIFNIRNDIDEERRLFYVALTRTKNLIYILTKIKHESVFIYDLVNNNNVDINYKLKIIKRNPLHKIK